MLTNFEDKALRVWGLPLHVDLHFQRAFVDLRDPATPTVYGACSLGSVAAAWFAMAQHLFSFMLPELARMQTRPAAITAEMASSTTAAVFSGMEVLAHGALRVPGQTASHGRRVLVVHLTGKRHSVQMV